MLICSYIDISPPVINFVVLVLPDVVLRLCLVILKAAAFKVRFVPYCFGNSILKISVKNNPNQSF